MHACLFGNYFHFLVTLFEWHVELGRTFFLNHFLLVIVFLLSGMLFGLYRLSFSYCFLIIHVDVCVYALLFTCLLNYN